MLVTLTGYCTILFAQGDYVKQWPQFRGPFATGIMDSIDIPVYWDINSGNNILWKIRIPGLGHSCPVIWDDKLFVTSAISGSGADSLKVDLYGDIDNVNDLSVHKFNCIVLIAKDGGVVYGRTMEWGSFDMRSRVTIIPRGFTFTGLTPDGENGKKWNAKYGIVGIDMMERDYLNDGMNEKGLAAGLFYHPGFASYASYEKDQADITEGMRSSTQWTTAWDLTNRILYFHTQHNRRVRALEMKDIDFSKLGHDILHLPVDSSHKQDIEYLTL